MPNNFDFSEIKDLTIIEVNPDGWVKPLFIEYGTLNDIKIFGKMSYYWRVKGTTHTFVIPTVRMDYLSGGNYKQHFKDVLEIFREDYINWEKEGFITKWSKEYFNQYSKFIII